MSIEIEVGLENATRVRPVVEEIPLEKEAKGFANPKVQRLAIFGGVVLIAAIVGLFLYYHNRESTDDAQIDGHITPIASKIYGKVANVLVDDNQAVKAGQVLVKIDPRDYQAAVDQAKRHWTWRKVRRGRREWTFRGLRKMWRAGLPARTRNCWERWRT